MNFLVNQIFVYGWLYFIYNKYKHLKDNKYNFMKKNNALCTQHTWTSLKCSDLYQIFAYCK